MSSTSIRPPMHRPRAPKGFEPVKSPAYSSGVLTGVKLTIEERRELHYVRAETERRLEADYARAAIARSHVEAAMAKRRRRWGTPDTETLTAIVKAEPQLAEIATTMREQTARKREQHRRYDAENPHRREQAKERERARWQGKKIDESKLIRRRSA